VKKSHQRSVKEEGWWKT